MPDSNDLSLSDGRHAGDNDDKVESGEEVTKNRKDETALSWNDSPGTTHIEFAKDRDIFLLSPLRNIFSKGLG